MTNDKACSFVKTSFKNLSRAGGKSPLHPQLFVLGLLPISHVITLTAPAVHRMLCGFASHASCECLRFFSKGKRVKNQKLLCPGKAKAQVAAAAARRTVVAIRRTAAAGAIKPATAAEHPVGAR